MLFASALLASIFWIRRTERVSARQKLVVGLAGLGFVVWTLWLAIVLVLPDDVYLD